MPQARVRPKHVMRHDSSQVVSCGDTKSVQLLVAVDKVSKIRKAVRTTGQTGLVVNSRPRNDIGDSGRERRADTKRQAVSKGILEALEQVATIRAVRKKGATRR
jgi:hypothetical protein